MDADLYSQAIEYEQLTQAVYQAIWKTKDIGNITVTRNGRFKGRSGVEHQIDVFWKYEKDEQIQTIIIECKNYSSNLTLEKVRNFFGVLKDLENTPEVGSVRGLLVTKVGYQSGTADFAKFYGIGLKLLRKPIEADWKERIKNLHFEIVAKSLVSTPEHPIELKLFLRASTKEQAARLQATEAEGKLKIPLGPNLKFLDLNGEECTDEIGWWLPQALNCLDKEEGVLYEEAIKMGDLYIRLDLGGPEPELVEVIGLVAKYYVETIAFSETIIHGQEIVEAILKDHFTDDVEFVKYRNDETLFHNPG
ncbi:restriction endonuclease [Desulfomonile tiedjei]|uniref:Restriction endonuclease type IV Mrr domain-containing protein n=1 Tax=Desulfomonile tiedjei (strain ATCC 49306 / DSM 6799 / DCB-1) TaxID=706587 RepID=I4CBD2_DESTA|nr:restriction endonuclease [Desulfomonile tiedjei]AFM26873.1 hypothetical protein Desti_4237 [Desulfomonile tiedjei DSM 6799]